MESPNPLSGAELVEVLRTLARAIETAADEIAGPKSGEVWTPPLNKKTIVAKLSLKNWTQLKRIVPAQALYQVSRQGFMLNVRLLPAHLRERGKLLL